MGIEKKELDIAKETDEVLVLLIGLVKDLKAKKSLTDIAASNLPALMIAMDGIDQVDDEYKANRKAVLATLGYRLGELGDTLAS